MLKKIDVNKLILGMFVKELCGNWIDSPFWKSSFLLEDIDTLNRIKQSEIKFVWIDLSKGLDAVSEERIQSNTTEERHLDKNVALPDHLSAADEMERAAEIIENAINAVRDLHTDTRLGKTIEIDQLWPLVDEITNSVSRNPFALLSLVRLKNSDDYTYMHSVAVGAMMIALSKQLGLDADTTSRAGMAGLFHDIGKISVDPTVLQKPGKLTDAEFDLIKQHPVAGHNILKKTKGICELVLDVCLHHHEKMDGTGYPDRLAGEQISLYAKMGAICDIYDAITSNRPYKKGWCPSISLQKMAEWTGSHLDNYVYQNFVKCLGIYPIGTLVKLQSGRLGVVVDQQIGKSLLTPKIRIFFSTKSMTYITPQLIDLASYGWPDKIVSQENIESWGLKEVDRYWRSYDA